MHLITITRPYQGSWQSGIWVVDGFVTDDLVLDQLPVFLGQPGEPACVQETCAALNLSDTLVQWTEQRDGITRH